MNEKAQVSKAAPPPDASWIWIGDGREDRNACVLFRREFQADAPEGLRLLISASTRYRAYLNGQRIAQGPPPSLPNLTYYDVHDLGRLLVPGRNCLVILVRQVRPRFGRGGLWAAIVDAGGAPREVTAAGWRCLRAPQWRRDTQFNRINAFDPFQEMYDVRKEPAGWMASGFEDSTWPAAAVVADPPWTVLVPRDIPPMAESRIRPQRIERVEECTWLENRQRPEDLSITLSQVGLPLRYARAENLEGLVSGKGPAVLQCSIEHLKDPTFDGVKDPCLVLDFGRVVTAYVELDLEGVEGASVDLGVAERLIDGQFSNAIEGMFAARYTMKAGRQTWRTFAWRGFRYLKLRLRECFQPLRLHGLYAATTAYPLQERGAFRSSDERLNRVFEMCRATLRLCSHESIMDTPWREQAQWLGDISAVTTGGLYACFGEVVLLDKFFRQSGAARRADGFIQKVTNASEGPGNRIIVDYSLWWIMAVWNHYFYSGERRWLEELFPAIQGVLEAHRPHIDAQGLICDMPNWVFIDWANVDRRGECTAYNAIFFGALQAAARIAETLGEAGQAADFRKTAEGVKANFVERLYDPRRGVFADANVGGRLSEMASEHASAAAIHFGLCEPKLAADIVRRIYQEKTVAVTEATPFFTAVVLRALDAAGRFDLAIEVIRDRWGRRMVDRGATSCFEEWGENGSWREGFYKGFMRTHSHAWSSAPAEFLIRNLAGIQILEGGCRKVRVDPRPVDFDYELTYPTPRGAIHVRRRDGKITVTCDKGIEIVRGGAGEG